MHLSQYIHKKEGKYIHKLGPENTIVVHVLHSKIFVTQLGVTCQLVAVTTFDLNHLNRLLCSHI